MSYMISTQPVGYSLPGLSLLYSRATQITLDFEQVGHNGVSDMLTVRGFTLWTWWHINLQVKSPAGFMVQEFGLGLNRYETITHGSTFYDLDDFVNLPFEMSLEPKIAELDRQHDAEVSNLVAKLSNLGNRIEESTTLQIAYGVIPAAVEEPTVFPSDWPTRALNNHFFPPGSKKNNLSGNSGASASNERADSKYIDLSSEDSFDHALRAVNLKAFELKTKPQDAEVTRDINTGDVKVQVRCKNKLNDKFTVFRITIPAGLDEKTESFAPGTILSLTDDYTPAAHKVIDGNETTTETIIDSRSSITEDFQSWRNKQSI